MLVDASVTELKSFKAADAVDDAVEEVLYKSVQVNEVVEALNVDC